MNTKIRLSFVVLSALLAVQCARPGLHIGSLRFPEGCTVEEKVELAACVVPSEKQLRWQQLELTAFLHFGINTFTGNEWGNGQDSPELFNPTALDCRQWVKSLKDAGFRMAILTAKHHDGFCLWQTQTTEYSVKNSPWKNGAGDVVRELSEACREYGMEFGVYLSPWDRNAECYGDSPAYNAFFIRQLTELLTNYGKVSEVWFDGACAEGPNGKRQVYDWPAILQTIHKLQPDAVTAIMGDDVRWVGNEGGVGRETEWSSTVLTPESYERSSIQNKELGINGMSKDLGSREMLAKAREVFWYPSEVDVSIRPGWFYHDYQDSEVRSLENLVDIYYKSVGRNSVLLLNIPPDRRGLIHEIDAQRILELRKYIDAAFTESLVMSPNKLWKADSGDSKVYDVRKDTVFNTLLIREDISKGQRVESFILEAMSEGEWVKIAEGTTVGYKRMLRFPEVRTDRIRVTVSSTRKTARISEVALYNAPPVSSYTAEQNLGNMDRSSWKALVSGSETSFDNSLATEWNVSSLTDLTIDLGKTAEIAGFVYAPGQDEDLSGTVYRYDFAVSQDGKMWKTVVSDGEFSNIMHNPVPYHVTLDSPCRARYIRLTPKEEISGRNMTSVGEIGVIQL
jgi:alpha-L-fucosidase